MRVVPLVPLKLEILFRSMSSLAFVASSFDGGADVDEIYEIDARATVGALECASVFAALLEAKGTDPADVCESGWSAKTDDSRFLLESEPAAE